MIDANYLLLLLKHMDNTLSEKESLVLKGYMDGNPDAERLYKHLSQIAEAANELDIPIQYSCPRPEELLTNVLGSSLRAKKNWFEIVFESLLKRQTAKAPVIDDNVALHKLRASKRRERQPGSLSILDQVSASRSDGSLNDDYEHVSLAEAIKNKIAECKVELINEQSRELLDAGQRQEISASAQIPVAEIMEHINTIFGGTTDSSEVVSVQDIQTQSESGCWTALSVDPNQLGKLGESVVPERAGHIVSLGKFILDQKSEQAIESLIQRGPRHDNLTSCARILTEDESAALHQCLSPITNQPGVAGCLIIGYDGMLIATTLPETADTDAFSAYALLTYMNTQTGVQMLGSEQKFRQLVSTTFKGHLLLADFGQGLLLAVSDNAATEAIIPLMRSVKRISAA